MTSRYILAIDQGTTGSRAFIFDGRGRVVGKAYREFTQYFPKPGWVEHDAEEIWRSCTDVIAGAVRQAKIDPSKIAAIGITNQRETVVVWDRKTGKPVHRAIVWQCRRTTAMCRTPRLQKIKDYIHATTGLVVDPYFSGTKVAWLLEHVPGLKAKARRGDICFGTIDSWLIWKLTGGAVHATDMTNASRTMIFNIHTKQWDRRLLDVFGIPSSMLPDVRESGAEFGVTAKGASKLPPGIPIRGVLGDQQAALYGQRCFAPGTVKNTYGTGCFIMLNTGDKAVNSKDGLLTTLASDVSGRPVYALEGAVFIGGAVVQWLRDQLKIIPDSSSTQKFIAGIKDNGGVYFVPAFVGLGAPYWDPEARGIISGLTRGSNAAHIVRAALESIAYQSKDVFMLMERSFGTKIRQLKVDGGACRNDFLMQFQSDILGCAIVRPKQIDTTVQGAAYLAGVCCGLWSPSKIARLQSGDRVFRPKASRAAVAHLYDGWQRAVGRSRDKF